MASYSDAVSAESPSVTGRHDTKRRPTLQLPEPNTNVYLQTRVPEHRHRPIPYRRHRAFAMVGWVGPAPGYGWRRTIGLMGQPDTKFVSVGRDRVAYQVWGEGPRDVLFLKAFAASVDAMWEHPGHLRFAR